MRQRTGTKTQRRLKQQTRDPYALTDDVYDETPTFHVGGLVTAVGVLQLIVGLALSGFMFGGALLFCAVLLMTLGVALLYRSDVKTCGQGIGLKLAINRLLALRRSVLDYSLTLSIAQSDEYSQTHNKKQQIAVVPSSPTPQKVVTTMALKEEEAQRIEQNGKTMTDTDKAPLVTISRVNLTPLPLVDPDCMETMEELIMKKPRANSEPMRVLRSRPLLPSKAKVQQLHPVHETKTPTQEQATTPANQEEETTHVHATVKSQQKTAVFEASKAAVKNQTQTQLPAVLSNVEPNVVIPAVLPMVESTVEKPKIESARIISPPTTVVAESAAKPLPIFPEHKPLIEVALGEPPIERNVVATRKVTLYLKSEVGSLVDLEEQDLEQTAELESESESFDLSVEAFPPLLLPIVPPQASMLPPAREAVEPNFLMDIKLEPISKQDMKCVSLSSLRPKPVGNADLRLMMDELDEMRAELDAVMARCTALLTEEEKASVPSLSKL